MNLCVNRISAALASASPVIPDPAVPAAVARLSAMEHLVPEQMFSTEDNPANGISAVKAIQLAAAEGQKIWTINQANLNTALANSQLSNDIKNDIRNAVHAGKEVTAHEKPLNFYGKTSAGYIILDPTTGAGAYMISSGENGGELSSDAPFSLLTGLMDAKDGLWKYFGSFINKAKQTFDFALDAENCGLGFAVVKFLSMLVMAIGLTYLLMPYFMLLSLGAALAYVTVLRILVIEVLLSGYFSSQFTCKE